MILPVPLVAIVNGIPFCSDSLRSFTNCSPGTAAFACVAGAGIGATGAGIGATGAGIGATGAGPAASSGSTGPSSFGPGHGHTDCPVT